MGAVGLIPALVGLAGTALAAGGAAYVTKRVVDGANNRSMERANAMQPDITASLQRSSQEKALIGQQTELARRQAAAKAQAALGTAGRRRNLLAPGVVTSNLGLTGTPNIGSSVLGN